MTRGYPFPISKEQAKQDKDFMKLRDQIFKVIPIAPEGDEKAKLAMRKKWKALRAYMGSYYAKR